MCVLEGIKFIKVKLLEARISLLSIWNITTQTTDKLTDRMIKPWTANTEKQCIRGS